MNMVEKSESIKAGIRRGFQDGSSRMAQRRCCGSLTVNQMNAAIVRQVFEQYWAGDSLGKAVEQLEKQGALFPTGKARWNREALNRLPSDEKRSGRVLLQKTACTGALRINHDDIQNKYLYAHNHAAIIPNDLFKAVQEEKTVRGKTHDPALSMPQIF